MQRYYLKLALTSLKRKPFHTCLMIFSLALGMYCFVMATVYVRFELTRNQHHEFSEDVYNLRLRVDGRNRYMPYSLATALKEGVVPGISTVSFMELYPEMEPYLTTDKENYVQQTPAFYADAEFFEVFTFPLKYGDTKSALSEPGKVVISNEVAEVLFGAENPVGQTLHVHERGDFQISGVLEEAPKNSVMNPALLFGWPRLGIDRAADNYKEISFVHVKAQAGLKQEQIEAGVWSAAQNLLSREGMTGIDSEKLADAYWEGSHADYGAQNYSIFGTDRQMILVVLYVAFGVLLCGFVGYVSLSLSNALRRSKEIGVRKVTGANIADIRKQFLFEALFYALVALIIVIMALELTQNGVSSLFQVPIALDLGQWQVLAFLGAFVLLTGFLAGTYPAFVLSRLRPSVVLKGAKGSTMSSFLLKRGLLTFQFFVTVFLVFSIYVLRLQVNEMVNFDPGYNSEDVFSMVISRNKPLNANRAVIEQEVQALPGVTMTVGGTFPFNMNGSRRMKLYREDSLLQSRVPIANITPGFFRTMQIDLLQGQSMEQLTDIPYEQACIVNEEFVEAYGLEVPIGLRLELNGQPKTIVGVCRDFSVWGVNNPKPMSQVFLVNETKYTSLLVKTDGSNRQETLASLNEIWRKYNPILSPSVHVLEEQNALKIASFTKLYKLFSLLAFMVVALSMMNLFGTALIFANAKIKNISIRKILGARTAELFGRLSSPFLINLLIGLSMAIPLGYLAMQQYLERYAVRISLNLWQALSVTVLMVVLVYLVIGYKMLRFSQTDPVKALKEE